MKLYTYNQKLAESVWWNLLWMTLGSLLMTICIQSVAAPHDFLAGGVMGVALLVAYWTGTLTPLLWYMLICLPIYIGGWFFVGRRFLLYTAYGRSAPRCSACSSPSRSRSPPRFTPPW